MAGKGIGCLAEAMGALRVSAKVCKETANCFNANR